MKGVSALWIIRSANPNEFHFRPVISSDLRRIIRLVETGPLVASECKNHIVFISFFIHRGILLLIYSSIHTVSDSFFDPSVYWFSILLSINSFSNFSFLYCHLSIDLFFHFFIHPFICSDSFLHPSIHAYLSFCYLPIH